MRRFVAIVLLFAGCVSVPALKSEDPAAEIWSFYAEGVKDPSVSVAIVRDGVPVFAGDPRAIYRIGSLTKFFVSEAALRLEDRGEIDLDRPLTAFASFRLDPMYGRVTMRELMEMRSGLPRDLLDWRNFFDWHTALSCGAFGTHVYSGYEDRGDFLEKINSKRALDFLAERKSRYSNVGFALFTILLEDAVGKGIDEIVRDEIVIPNGLHDTTFAPSADKLSRLTRPCAGKLPWCWPRGWEVSEHRLGETLRGMGGLYSTVEDCVKFFASSERVRASKLLSHKNVGGFVLDYRFGMVYGGGSFVAFPQKSRDFMIVFRNVTSWPASEDFELAAGVFRK